MRFSFEGGTRAVQGFFVAAALGGVLGGTVKEKKQIAHQCGDAACCVSTHCVELKYCEACGVLWLRPRGKPAIYCIRCKQIMAELSRRDWGKPAERKRP